MKTNRCLPLACLWMIVACLVTLASPAYASDEEDVKQIQERYSAILGKFSENCIAKDSLAASCNDVTFANKNNMLSNSLKLLLAKDAQRARKRGMGNLDFGFLINGQDSCKAPLRIVSVNKAGSAYVLRMNNGCKQDTDSNPNYEFIIINESGKWVIDDAVYYLPKRTTLKSILK